MRFIFIVVMVVVMVGCTKNTDFKVEYPDKMLITEQSRQLAVLPDYLLADEDGDAVPVTKGDAVPFSGILISDDESFAVASLRIKYDDTYQVATLNTGYLISVIEMQERELYRGEQLLQHKERLLEDKNLSWWGQHKTSVGVSLGIVIGVALALGTGKVWSLVDKEN